MQRKKHGNLKPVVNNDFCKSLGMETSLFERYQKQAWMLDTQYRMVRLSSSCRRKCYQQGLAEAIGKQIFSISLARATNNALAQ